MNKAQMIFKRSAPAMLTGLSILGTGVVAYLSGVNTIKALELKEAERPRTRAEKASVYIRSYWPTALAFTLTSAAAIGSHKMSADQITALLATCVGVEQRFKDYREVVKEELGADRENDIYIEVAKEKWAITPEIPHKIDDYDDSYVFYDIYSRRHFVSSIERVQQAMYHLNRNFAMRGYACANEFYQMLGIGAIENGDIVGWEATDLMESGLAPWINFCTTDKVDNNGVKMFIINFEVEPTVEAIERAFD